MIHYHGTPITPNDQLMRMVGRHFCVPFPRPDNLKVCLQIGQSLMFDNGAFSAFTRGEPFNEAGYYEWLEPILAHPHFAVIPDVIDGGVEQQNELIGRWPFHDHLGAPVWHLGEPIEHMLELIGAGWTRICFGSSGAYWDVGGPAWCGRMDEAFNAIERHYKAIPWIHGLRMLGQSERWPLASADSTNVAQNFKRDTGCADCKAARIDAVQAPSLWSQQPIQQVL